MITLLARALLLFGIVAVFAFGVGDGTTQVMMAVAAVASVWAWLNDRRLARH